MQEPDLSASRPRFSVVIPTFQRRVLVGRALASLTAQDFDNVFEVVVVVDGSTDGTADALRSFEVPFPLTVIEQPNQGASRARNHGASRSAGEILLFLDDDMEADRHLLAEHDRSHRDGAEAVMGSIPLHPSSPDSLLTLGVKAWTDERAHRLSNGQAIPFDDIITGQLSIGRRLFDDMGGFDERFTRSGAYGAEDVEFGQRLLNARRQVAFNIKAISHQHYEVTATAHLRQYRQVGHADVAIVRKHPELGDRTFAGKRRQSEIHQLVWRPVLAFPRGLLPLWAALRKGAIAAVDSGRSGRLATWLFHTARATEYWLGVGEAGGVPYDGPVRVLNYHAVADLGDDPILRDYGVPPEQFAQQLDVLARTGHHFLEPDEFLRYLDGDAGVPKRALLLTFDDCYRDLLEAAVPLLEERAIPAIAFAVSGHLGGTNTWDQRVGARPLELLEEAELAKLPDLGVEIGAHSRTHRPLDQVSPEEIDEEVAGSAAALQRVGLDPVRFYAYPHGAYNTEVQAAALRAHFGAAFTVDAGRVRRGSDRYALPRVEILREDEGWRFRWKVLTAGWRPAPRARLRHLRRRLRSISSATSLERSDV